MQPARKDNLGDDPKKSYAAPTANAIIKDPNLPPEQLLEVNAKQLTAAKNGSIMKAIQCKFLPDGPDRTISEQTVYGKTVKIEGIFPQQSIYELRHALAKQENIDVEDVNFCSRTTNITDQYRVGDLHVEWVGLGFDVWPPNLIVKPRIRGFEVSVLVERCRDTSLWKDGNLTQYQDLEFTFDVEPSSTVRELKELVANRSKIPADRQILTAQIHKNNRSCLGEYVTLEDDSKTMSDYGIDTFCARITLEKNPFDANGMYVFDDAYFDSAGYHPQPMGTWIPQDSIGNRSRPDAQPNDPMAPAMILTDRAAAAAARSD